MPKDQQVRHNIVSTFIRRLFRYAWKSRGWFGRAVTIFILIIGLFVGSMYGVARWYIAKHADEPLTFGATFIPDYARSLNLDPKTTLQAVIDDLDIDRLRLVSYWKNYEKFPGVYDFSELDWQFEIAQKANVKVSLSIGLRQPRWPECHEPDWVKGRPVESWYPQLKMYLQRVIERYGNNPVLESYQLENEFFLTGFGECPDHSRWRLEDEYKFVKELDPNTPVIISRSNNLYGLPLGNPRPDEFGISVYKRVWDAGLTKRYYEYPFPAWYYASLAGWAEILTGKNSRIHELQAEAWLPTGYLMVNAPIDELYKSMNPKRLEDRFSFAVATGFREIDLWGVEWWYQMKTQRNEPGLWDVGKQQLQKHHQLTR